MAYRFMLEVPEVVYEDAKIAIGGVRDARILIGRHPESLNGRDHAYGELSVTAYSLDVIDVIYQWMQEAALKQDVYLNAYKGERLRLADFDARSMRRRIQGEQYWMENTIPRIGNVESTMMEGGARVADVPYGGRMAAGEELIPAEQSLAINGVDHLAVRVRDMARAEEFYRDFFGMNVIYRARRAGDRWQHLDASFDWVESIHTGVVPELARLENGPLGLVLINAGQGAVMHENRVAYISVDVPQETLQIMRGKALFASYTIQEDSPRAFRFIDPYGISWQIVATS